MPQAGLKISQYLQSEHPDLAGLLSVVAAHGFVGVETGNLFRLKGDGVRVRRLFSESGLALCGLHAGFAEFEIPDQLAENVRFVQSLGSRYLLCNGLGERSSRLAGYRDAAKLFNEVGKFCQEAGIFFCYHLQTPEFDKSDGTTSGVEVLDQETDAKVVKYCVDVDALRRQQVDPVCFINDHRERAIYFQFRIGTQNDSSTNPSRPLDQGVADLKAAYLAAAALTPEWIVFEQACNPGELPDCIQGSRNFIREQLGI